MYHSHKRYRLVFHFFIPVNISVNGAHDYSRTKLCIDWECVVFIGRQIWGFNEYGTFLSSNAASSIIMWWDFAKVSCYFNTSSLSFKKNKCSSSILFLVLDEIITASILIPSRYLFVDCSCSSWHIPKLWSSLHSKIMQGLIDTENPKFPLQPVSIPFFDFENLFSRANKSCFYSQWDLGRCFQRG